LIPQKKEGWPFASARAPVMNGEKRGGGTFSIVPHSQGGAGDLFGPVVGFNPLSRKGGGRRRFEKGGRGKLVSELPGNSAMNSHLKLLEGGGGGEPRPTLSLRGTSSAMKPSGLSSFRRKKKKKKVEENTLPRSGEGSLDV